MRDYPWGRTVNTRTVRARRSALALVAAAGLAAGAGACGGDHGEDLPPPPASPPGGPASTLDPQRQEILDTYYGSVDAMVRAQQAGDPEHPDLAQYFAEDTAALVNLKGTIARNTNRGMYYAGDLVVASAEVTDIDTDPASTLATIESCLDYADYRLVHREDDTPVPDLDPVGRVTVRAEALRADDDHWYIVANTAHWDEPC